MKYHISFLDILNSKTKVNIIEFMLNHEALMSEREIASILKVSHMSVNRTMRELADINLVNFVTVGKAHLWKINRNSYSYKILSNLLKNISNKSMPLKDLINVILQDLPEKIVKKAVLFGSVSKGTEKSDSDIDLFILVSNKADKEILEPEIEKLSNKCLEIYGNRLAPYILTTHELKQKKELKIISEIDKGVQIYPGKK
ncbi:MAG: nucleotidyltransferase domain-containing protein [Elusimicrobiota bacterium]